MKNIIKQITPRKTAIALLSALLITFTGIFTIQAYAESTSAMDMDPAHYSNDVLDTDPSHHRDDANFMDMDPAHMNAMDMDPAHNRGNTTTTSPSPSISPSPMPTGMDMNTGTGMDTNMTGFTDGWLNGRTVTFFYHNKDFFCQNPPASGATSHCEAGADAQSTPPQSGIPPLYVMTPLGFTPDNLQCPESGNCINHPHTIDLSAVLGAGTENAQLPPHSHIVTTANPGWWKIVVIGVKTQEDWNKIAAGKSITTVRDLQASDPTNVTADIPTNSFLFFDVISHGNYQINGSQLINEN